MKQFYRNVVEIFSQQYLRKPNNIDIAMLLYIGEEHGFFGLYALEKEKLSNSMGWTIRRP